MHEAFCRPACKRTQAGADGRDVPCSIAAVPVQVHAVHPPRHRQRLWYGPPALTRTCVCADAVQMPTFATKRQLENHKAEPLLFEVQLLRVAGVKR